MKTREQIISNMCYTWRHDFGLNKNAEDCLSSGLTESERKRIWCKMSQIFDNCIAPMLTKVPDSRKICDND